MSLDFRKHVTGRYDRAKSAELLSGLNSIRQGPHIDNYKKIMEVLPHEAAEIYCFSDSSAHTTTPAELLYLSDIMADDQLQRFDLLAAEARLEYLLKMTDDQFEDHHYIARDLLNQVSLSNLSDFELHHLFLLCNCAPLYNMARNKPMSYETLLSVQQGILEIIKWLVMLKDSSTNDITKASLAGYANELSVLVLMMGLNDNYNNLSVLPAFTHQDAYRVGYFSTESPGYGSKCKAFDIAVYRRGTSELVDKIQVKTSKDQITGDLEYEDDIKVIYAREIADEYLKLLPNDKVNPELFSILASTKDEESIKLLKSLLNKHLQEPQKIYIPKPRASLLDELLTKAS